MALAVALLKVVEKKGFSLVHYISSCISVGNDLLGLIIDHTTTAMSWYAEIIVCCMQR